MYLYPCIGSFNLAYCQGFLCPILDLTECPMCEMFPASVPGPDRLEVSPRALVHPCPAFPMVSSGSRYLVFGSIFWGLVFDLRAQILPSNEVLPSYSTLHLLTLLFT